LLLHFTLVEASAQLNKAIRQGRFPMIDMGNNRKIPDLVWILDKFAEIRHKTGLAQLANGMLGKGMLGDDWSGIPLKSGERGFYTFPWPIGVHFYRIAIKTRTCHIIQIDHYQAQTLSNNMPWQGYIRSTVV
jgi:hypothetical protein